MKEQLIHLDSLIQQIEDVELHNKISKALFDFVISLNAEALKDMVNDQGLQKPQNTSPLEE